MPFTAIMSILWLNAAADQTIEIMKFVSDHYNLNIVLLAVTLISIGNTLSDYFVETSFASKGKGIMAVTGAIACQFFNLVMGWGLNILKIVLYSKDKEIEFQLFNFNDSDTENETSSYALLIISFCIVNLVIMTIIPQIRGRT